MRVMKEEQLVFDFYVEDKPCRTCAYASFNLNGWLLCVYCGLGQIGLHFSLRGGRYVDLPDYCVCYKRGGEKMPYINVKKLTEQELREELRRIREERCGVGRKKRRESRERRVKSAKKEKEYIDL